MGNEKDKIYEVLSLWTFATIFNSLLVVIVASVDPQPIKIMQINIRLAIIVNVFFILNS